MIRKETGKKKEARRKNLKQSLLSACSLSSPPAPLAAAAVRRYSCVLVFTVEIHACACVLVLYRIGQNRICSVEAVEEQNT